MRAKWLLPAILVAGLLLSLGGAAPVETRDDKDLRANARARMEAAKTVYKGMLARFRTDPNFHLSFSRLLRELYLWSTRWLEAQIEMSAKKADHIDAAVEHLIRMRELEKSTLAARRQRMATDYEVAAAEFYRLDAEKQVLKLKKK
jgi:hypothetical protein